MGVKASGSASGVTSNQRAGALAGSDEREAGHVVDEPVVGEDREPRRLQREERHQLVARGRDAARAYSTAVS